MIRHLNTNIPFMKYRWQLLAISMLLVAISIFLYFKNGLNYGTDFRGGLTLTYEFKTAVNDKALQTSLDQAGLKHFIILKIGESQQNSYVIKVDPEQNNTQSSEELAKPFTQAFEKSLGSDKVKLAGSQFVGPKAGKELRTKAIMAIIWAWIIILVYVGFRFDFNFAPGAIIALIHDVVIVIGAFALTGREFNLTVVAAILTIIGYSINDTIIVFDRIREDLERHKGMELVALVNRSINETLTRTLITSFTVFLVSIVLEIFTEGEIKNFGFAMIFGVITGTYSSAFIAAPIFVFLKQRNTVKSRNPKLA